MRKNVLLVLCLVFFLQGCATYCVSSSAGACRAVTDTIHNLTPNIACPDGTNGKYSEEFPGFYRGSVVFSGNECVGPVPTRRTH